MGGSDPFFGKINVLLLNFHADKPSPQPFANNTRCSCACEYDQVPVVSDGYMTTVVPASTF